MTNENSTLVHEGVTSINGTLFRKVNRKASVGEKVLITELGSHVYSVGDVTEIEKVESGNKGQTRRGSSRFGWLFESEYVVLEPIVDEETLTLTEADVRNNSRQVIDLIANLARRLTLLEGEHQALGERLDAVDDILTDRIDRLASANEQAISTVARNVETWAQEFENFKHSPAPWATQEEVVDLAKKVADINERTQPYQQAHELFVKIAGGMNGRDLTEEERREL
ncbi:hypothetical protein KYJ26_16785 [Bacillus sp. MCCB 382]|uniref:hypothetical protein n=1 Tax=Bacillus sp. MCCB 382 TaxID=2860197 RepID=UPI001C572E16|nr:hypothetical protein [Bacillus sp. MCCB 382]